MAACLAAITERHKWDLVWLSELDNMHAEFECGSIDDAVSPHQFVRHYGGEGNTSYGFIIHSDISSLVVKLTMHDRTAGILLAAAGVLPLAVVGLHGRMHTDAESTLAEISAVLSDLGINRNTQLAVVGDFNIDQAYTFESNSDRPQEPQTLSSARDFLSSWCEEYSSEVILADEWLSWPGGNADPTDLVPYTRFPMGDLALTQRPSVLDYACVSKNSCAKSWLDWMPAMADHALHGIDVRWSHATPMRLKTHWSCLDEEQCLSWIQSLDLDRSLCTDSDLVKTFKNICVEAQSMWACQNTCSQRRTSRLPLQLRDVYSRISSATDEGQRLQLQKQAWQMRRKWVTDLRNRVSASNVSKGRVISKSKKLHHVKSVLISGVRSSGEAGANAIKQDFENKWCNDLHMQSLLIDILNEHDAVSIKFESEEVSKALNMTRRIRKLDGTGICIAVVKLVFAAFPEYVTGVLGCLAGNIVCLREERIQGKVFGKESSHPEPSECRAILPLSSLLTLLDCILSARLSD